jgi:hypothetical protein
MVYFVRILDGRIKIGCTMNFPCRRSEIGARYGRPIQLLALIPGYKFEEAAFHWLFRDIRTPKTELFDAAPRLLEFIDSLPAPVIRRDCDVKPFEMALEHRWINGSWHLAVPVRCWFERVFAVEELQKYLSSLDDRRARLRKIEPDAATVTS